MVSSHSCAKLYQGHHHTAVRPSIWAEFSGSGGCATPGGLAEAPRGGGSSPRPLSLSLHSLHVRVHVVFLCSSLWFLGQNLSERGSEIRTKRPVRGGLTRAMKLHQRPYTALMTWFRTWNLAPHWIPFLTCDWASLPSAWCRVSSLLLFLPLLLLLPLAVLCGVSATQ